MNLVNNYTVHNKDAAANLSANSNLKWFFYNQSEGAGTTLSDFGVNAPDLTITNPGNAWTNGGWLTWDTTTYCQVVGNSYIDSAMRPDDAKQICTAFTLYVDGSGSANVTYLSYGRATSGKAGGYILNVIDADSTWRLQAIVTGTDGTQVTSGTTGEILATGGNTYTCVFDWDVENGWGEWYIDGNASGNSKPGVPTDLDGAATTGGLVLGARMGSSAVDSYMGKNYSTLDLRTAGFFFIKRTDRYDSTLASRLGDGFLDNKYSLPAFLGNYT